MDLSRRSLIALAAISPVARAMATTSSASFPDHFLWGAATAGHQVEGNNVNADTWLLENVTPTLYAERSGDALNSLELWQDDLDLVKSIGLNSYRFSLEWARIEPDKGHFSSAMLDHYKRIVTRCRAMGITPVVTFNHYTTPIWFARQGGWTNPESVELFARFCQTAARHLASQIGYATTLNEPNVLRLMQLTVMPAREEQRRKMLASAAKAIGVEKFVAGNAANAEDFDIITRHQLAGHRQGRAAIKAERSDLPVGVSLAIIDEQAVPSGEHKRDEIREQIYGAWLEAAKDDDFIGVQNYERNVWSSTVRIPPEKGVQRNGFGGEVYPASLAGAVRYAHQMTKRPVLITEHGITTRDDAVRAHFIPAALKELHKSIDEGVPVLGYIHWSLVDNFEWSLGYWPTFGLSSVDRTTFKRTLKPSASILGRIAQSNAL